MKQKINMKRIANNGKKAKIIRKIRIGKIKIGKLI